MAEPTKQAQKLNGWKEIAEYLGVSVRTAQTLEGTQCLPVHCHGVGKKAPVYTTIGELDAWKTNLDAARQEDSTGPPQVTKAEELNRRRWLRYSLTGGGVVVGIAGLGLGAVKFISSGRQPPSAYRVEGATLVVSGRNNIELWRYTLPQQMSEQTYHDGTNRWCRFSDLDGDGMVECVFVYSPIGGHSSLWCFGVDGNRRWVFTPGKEVSDNLRRKFAPPYSTNSFDIILSRNRGHAHIVASSHHNWSFPDQVAALDGRTGKVLSEYWHRGHLWHMAVADLDGDGEPEVLLGGVNDAREYKQATLVVFDHRRISGATRNPAGEIYFQGMDPGTEKWVVFFPRTPISQQEEFNRVIDVRVESGRIRVSVAEGISEAAPCIIYELDFTLRPVSATLVGTLIQLYRELQESGKLPKESPEAIAERLMKEIKVIEGTNWRV